MSVYSVVDFVPPRMGCDVYFCPSDIFSFQTEFDLRLSICLGMSSGKSVCLAAVCLHLTVRLHAVCRCMSAARLYVCLCLRRWAGPRSIGSLRAVIYTPVLCRPRPRPRRRLLSPSGRFFSVRKCV